jgi:hypothetical protein
MNNNFTGPYPAEITALALSDTDLAQVAPDENDPTLASEKNMSVYLFHPSMMLG